MAKKTELKPCPFCGGEAIIWETERFLGKGLYYYPRCRTENCVGNNGWVHFVTKTEATKAWHRRPK